MVTIHIKGESSEDQQFLFECSSNSTIDEITHSVSEIANLQSKIQNLSLSIRSRMLTDRFKEDHPEVAVAIDRILSEAESYSSKDQVVHKRALSPIVLRDHIRGIEKEIKTAQSKGLIGEDLLQVFADHGNHEDIQLWWAGKELKKGKKLSEYIGENEKTKITVTLKSTSLDQQHLNDLAMQISSETDPIALLPKVVALLYLQVYNKALQASGSDISAAISQLKDKVPDSTLKLLMDYHKAIVTLFALQAAASGDEEDCTADKILSKKEWLEWKMPELKSLVLGISSS